MKIQDLLAPTWPDRLRSENALINMHDAFFKQHNDAVVEFLPELQKELDALKPSPEVFLSAMVAFWADVSEQVVKERMKEFNYAFEPYDASTWASDHSAVYPMESYDIKKSSMLMPGISIWGFIENLGTFSGAIEAQLIGCLYHPEYLVSSCAEKALGHADHISDMSCQTLIQFAKVQGRNGNIWERSQVIAKHMTLDRLPMVLKGLTAEAPEKTAQAMFCVIGYLKAEVQRSAYSYLEKHLNDGWSNEQLANIINAISSPDKSELVLPSFLAFVRELSSHEDPSVQSAVAFFLSKLSPHDDKDHLLSLVNQGHEWVLHSVCRGLAQQKNVADDLIQATVEKSIGNYDAHDGMPHDQALALLLSLDEITGDLVHPIKAWWETTDVSEFDYREVDQILDLNEKLGDKSVFMNDRLIMLHEIFNGKDEVEEKDEWPTLDEPGAVDDIKNRIELEMIEAGANPEEAKVHAINNATIMGLVAAGLGDIQADIDALEVAYDHEMKAIYGEEWDDGFCIDQEGLDDVTEDDSEYEDIYDVIVRRLNDKIKTL